MERLFFDMEFTGLHQNTTLISIALVGDNCHFYCELDDYDSSQLDSWLKENVVGNLKFSRPEILMPTPLPKNKTIADYPKEAEQYYYTRHKPYHSPRKKAWLNAKYSVNMMGTVDTLKKELSEWLKQFDEVEMWGDCLSYDWVLFCQIWGHAFKIPKNIYYIPFDICTVFKEKGVDPDVNRVDFCEHYTVNKQHNALYDAQIIKKCYEKLSSIIYFPVSGTYNISVTSKPIKDEN